MSILQKGTLTVVIVTVIASGMIVLTGNSIADDKSEINTKGGSTVSLKQSSMVPKRDKDLEKTIVRKTSKTSLLAVGSKALAPPPGPFLNKDVVRSVQKSLLAPATPKGPTYLPKKPEQPIKPITLKTAPALPSVDPIMKSAPSFRQAPVPAKMPQFKGAAPAMPENNTKQPDVISEELPIWMQKRNTTEQQHVLPKDSTKQHQSKMGIPNMGLNNNYPAQQYIYVPVPMMPSNMRPPQMPVFNRSITPPSTYWGATVAPKNAPTTSIQKESENSNSMPTQKDDK